MKRLIKWFKHKEETEEDVYTRWEKDFDLIPLPGLFYEYLELGMSVRPGPHQTKASTSRLSLLGVALIRISSYGDPNKLMRVKPEEVGHHICTRDLEGL